MRSATRSGPPVTRIVGHGLGRHAVDPVGIAQPADQLVGAGKGRVAVDGHRRAGGDGRGRPAPLGGQGSQPVDGGRQLRRRQREGEPPVAVGRRPGQRGVGHAADDDRRDGGARCELHRGAVERRPALPAIRSGSTASAASRRRPRSRRGTPAAAHDGSWRSPPTPTPSSSRSPDTCCSEATCLAAHTTGRSGTIITP